MQMRESLDSTYCQARRSLALLLLRVVRVQLFINGCYRRVHGVSRYHTLPSQVSRRRRLKVRAKPFGQRHPARGGSSLKLRFLVRRKANIEPLRGDFIRRLRWPSKLFRHIASVHTKKRLARHCPGAFCVYNKGSNEKPRKDWRPTGATTIQLSQNRGVVTRF